MLRYHSILLTSLLALLAGPVRGAEPDPGIEMYEYATCAVYFRMVVGSMSSRGRDLGPLAALEREKMDKAMALARAKSIEENGEESSEAMFQEEWRTILADMNDQINRNYDNVGRLKARYDTRCEAMIAPG